MIDKTHQRRLLISISAAETADTVQVQVWHRLRSLGTLYPQPSADLLSDWRDIVQEVRLLVDRVRYQDNKARLLSVPITDSAERAAPELTVFEETALHTKSPGLEPAQVGETVCQMQAVKES